MLHRVQPAGLPVGCKGLTSVRNRGVINKPCTNIRQLTFVKATTSYNNTDFPHLKAPNLLFVVTKCQYIESWSLLTLKTLTPSIRRSVGSNV
jgi:hypothetical protein